MLRFLIIMTAAITVSFTGASAENYYMSPSGSDGNGGLSPTDAWATLQHVRDHDLSAGDTLFIMGGTYTSAQYYHDYDGRTRGSAGNPIVFKAYGDAVAVFTSTGPHADGRWWRGYFIFYNGGCDHVTIDGYSSLSPSESLYIRFEGHEDTQSLIYVRGNSGDYCENIEIRGVEVDGSKESAFSGGANDVEVGINYEYCRYGKLENNYVHHIHHPTGPLSPGDNSDRHQNAGHGIWLTSTELTLIQNNRVERCNHGAIEIVRATTSSNHSQYNRVINNVIEQHYGGGIYLTFNSRYNLLDGNIITHCGETTDYAKPAVQVSGSNNVLRRNVVYNPINQAFRLEGNTFSGFHYVVDGNMVYNNTVFGSRYSLGTTVNNNASSSCSTENNTIANNIFYKSVGTLVDSGGRQPEIGLDTYWANTTHNWLTTCSSTSMAYETHFGGNTFHNNCIRRNDQGGDYSQLVVWTRDSNCTSRTYDLTLDVLQGADPVAWVGNIGDNPLIASEFPDEYGLASGWWRLRETSPCIDAGTPVYDENGAYVESLHPGYGWLSLTYMNDAPDMGAHESDGEEHPAPYSGRDIRISPTNR